MDPWSAEYDSLEYEPMSRRLLYKVNQERCLTRHWLKNGIGEIVREALRRRELEPIITQLDAFSASPVDISNSTVEQKNIFS